MWAKGLSDRVQVQMDVLDAAHYLTAGVEAEEAKHSFDVLSLALKEFRERMHKDWNLHLVLDGIDLSARLDIKLLRKDEDGDMLALNFDPHLLRFYSEIVYWEKQKFPIPFSKDVTDLAAGADKMRILRENAGFGGPAEHRQSRRPRRTS